MGEYKHLVREQELLHEADFMAEIVIDSDAGRYCLFRTVRESDLLGGREFYDWIKNIEHSGVTALSTVRYKKGLGG